MARSTNYSDVICTAVSQQQAGNDFIIATLKQTLTDHYGSMSVSLVGLDDPQSYTRTRCTYILVRDKRVLGLETSAKVEAINASLRATEERDGEKLYISQILSNRPILSEAFEWWRAEKHPLQSEVDERLSEIERSQRVCRKDKDGNLVPVEDDNHLPLYRKTELTLGLHDKDRRTEDMFGF